jgi:enamine deaminase RidA (YjgF/YER057c/UK114 family)
MHVERWPSATPRPQPTVACNGLLWTVANATDPSAGFEDQVIQSLSRLESHLQEAGSARSHLLSLQVLLADIQDRDAFDRLWCEWIGPDPTHWLQRACFQAALAPGLLVELIAVAAPASASLGLGGDSQNP